MMFHILYRTFQIIHLLMRLRARAVKSPLNHNSFSCPPLGQPLCLLLLQQCHHQWLPHLPYWATAQTHGGRNKKMDKNKPRWKKPFSQQRPDTLLQITLTQPGWCLPQLCKTAQRRTPCTSQNSSCNRMSSLKPETSEMCQMTPESELWSTAVLERARQDSPLDQRRLVCVERVVIGWNSEETGFACWYTLLSLHSTKNAVAPFEAWAAQSIISWIP